MKKYLLLIVALIFIYAPLFAQDWSQLGTGTHVLKASGEIYALTADRMNNIYAAGSFGDDSLRQNVFKWNGTDWTELGGSAGALHNDVPITTLFADTAGNIYAAIRIDSMYAGGLWTVVKWDGTSWNQLGSGSSALYAHGGIESIIMDRHGNLYAAGGYTSSGHYFVAKWDGTSWSELGSGSSHLLGNNYINTLCTDTAGNIYAAGDFTDGASYATGNVYVAKWDGASWSELGAGIAPTAGGGNRIFSIVADTNGNVYAAGTFRNDSNKCYVAKWDGSSWSELGSGSAALKANDAIITLCMDLHGSLYAGGYFTDSLLRPYGYAYIAKWNGYEWSRLGSGFNHASYTDGFVAALCVDVEGNIYAGGNFTDTTVSLYVDTVLFPWDSLPYHPAYVAKYGSATSSVKEHAQPAMSIFPNPAHNAINIVSPSVAEQDNEYTIYDATGRSCISGALQNTITTVNVEQLPPGVYLLQIGKHALATYRIVKK